MKSSKNIHSFINNRALTAPLQRKKRDPKHTTPGDSKNGFNKFLFLFIILFCAGTMMVVKTNALHNTEIQEGIAKEIIRFHVIANSDSNKDQALKLKVKDQLVKKLSPLLKNASSIGEARAIIKKNEDLIQKVAIDTIKKNGYDYTVKVSLGKTYFPLKLYGNYSFPPGYYEALRVQIGDAQGKNWWCVMFPPLCFVDETYSIVDEETNQKLKHLLTKEEYDTLITQHPIKIKFKLWETLKDFLQ